MIVFTNSTDEPVMIFMDNRPTGFTINSESTRSSDWLSTGNHSYSYFIKSLPQAIVKNVYIEKCSRVDVKLSWEDPLADFSANKTTVNVGEIINFTDLSTNEPSEWLWDFGDGGVNIKRIV